MDSQYHVFFLYSPVASHGEDVNQEIKNFFLEVIGLFSSRAELKDPFNESLHFLIKPDFTLKAFREMLEPQNDIPAPKPPVQAVQTVPAREEPVENIKEKAGFGKFRLYEEKRQEKAGKKEKAEKPSSPEPAVFGGDILIPGGMPQMPVPETKQKTKPKQDKKGFSWFGKKKPSKVELHLEDYVVPADQHQEERRQESQVYQPESWSGTVMEDEGGGTVMEGDRGALSSPCLMYQGKAVPLSRFPFTIGKQNCSLCMSRPTVSRRHATITMEQGVYFITDENSTNNTYVNGQVIPPYSPVPLSDGDRIACSSEEMIFKKG